MDNTTMAAAVAQPRPSPPRAAAGGSRRGFFAFLKDGVLVTTQNHGLFLPLATLHAAPLAVPAARFLAMWYLGRLRADGGDDLVKKFVTGNWWLLPIAAAANLVADMAYVALSLVIHVATVFAAVSSCSAASIDGGPGRTTLTLASLIGKVRRNLRGPMVTAVFAKVTFVALGIAVIAVLATAEAYVGAIPVVKLVPFLLHLTAHPFLVIYDSVVVPVSVVVSVAEPGLRAGGAVRRARQLTRGGKKLAQATLHAKLSSALNKAVWKMSAVPLAARLPHSTAATAAPLWLGAAVAVHMLIGAVEVLYTATVTAYYFDCKRTQEEKAGHIHME